MFDMKPQIEEPLLVMRGCPAFVQTALGVFVVCSGVTSAWHQFINPRFPSPRDVFTTCPVAQQRPERLWSCREVVRSRLERVSLCLRRFCVFCVRFLL